MAAIDGGKCVTCGVCQRACIYGAARVEDKAYRIAPEECVGCGLCAQMCPVGAVALEGLAEPVGFELGVK